MTYDPKARGMHRPRMTIRRLAAIEELLSGKSIKATAEKIGISTTTLRDWINYDRGFQEQLERHWLELQESVRRKILPLAAKALDRVDSELDGEEASTRLNAATLAFKVAKLIDQKSGDGAQVLATLPPVRRIEGATEEISMELKQLEEEMLRRLASKMAAKETTVKDATFEEKP